ncbi:uncharacterized protein LACBIDRAFT_305893 [Laccaria bicolor S238N-H82]|uniref:Predicted protein n=1 Tax=Laccaria bicolor (strain S238N-H82 / ATCC MYA-4686) TaxID=486041 RepID=B0CS68_LACBS|nr:uncharacterized protein LACBIDRAFT_305893 [Laccaria bicolor S238N-H82]EDR14251.1 predicted protein [Laccaria bicolor S238N-H82]|eukprot:XP_001874810.1 predicted protein [Laccaria bicolor S238N-H82]
MSFTLTRQCRPSVFRFHALRAFHSTPKASRLGLPARNASSSNFVKVAAATSLGVGLSFTTKPTIYCDGEALPKSQVYLPDLPPPPASSLSLYELGFGTVAGLCAGVFVKKGAKALAVVLGGVFVLLQYMASTSVVRIDWGRVSSRFGEMFYRRDGTGTKKPPTVSSIWNTLIDFLTADFQPRASFIVGFALGIRVG